MAWTFVSDADASKAGAALVIITICSAAAIVFVVIIIIVVIVILFRNTIPVRSTNTLTSKLQWTATTEVLA